MLKHRTSLKRSHLYPYNNPVLILMHRSTASRYHGTNFSPMQLYYFSHRTFSIPFGHHIICNTVIENNVLKQHCFICLTLQNFRNINMSFLALHHLWTAVVREQKLSLSLNQRIRKYYVNSSCWLLQLLCRQMIEFSKLE